VIPGLLKRLRAFGVFWWDFVVGDDWRFAAGVVTALGLTALAAHRDVTAWWIVPTAVLLLLGGSVLAASRSGRRG
jgi:hypothetical protein